MGINIGQVLRQPALRTPERTAVVEVRGEERVEVSYGELDRRARRAAGALLHAGVAPGDAVALSAANGVSFLACWFGAVYAGCTVVPVPVLSAAPELAFRMRHARCRALVTDAPRRELGERAMGRLEARCPHLDTDDALADASTAVDAPADVPPEAAAMVLYTSGTTGKPKGARITHASLFAHTSALVHHTLRLGPDARVLGALPLTHSFGIRMVALAPFYAGGRCVLVPRFDAERTLRLLRTEGVTWLPAVPTMFAAWANLPAGVPGPSSVRWCLSAGAPLTEDVRRRAEARLGAEVRQGYGLTEATFSTIDAPPDPPAPGSVGRPVWGIEVRVVDPRGRPLPPGEEGEVVIRGQNVMGGYLGDPEATARVLKDGWLHSGDVGVLDAEGRLSVVDRIKDMIIRGGNNVYPSEVEDVLAEHPAVAEVAVVGRPDTYYGEEVVAVVVPRDGSPPDPRELLDWSLERMARTKVPRELAVVDALPLGPSGKVLKRELRAMLRDGRLVAVPTRNGGSR
ncbi:MAG: class I adenylate-forming enzyme family protein [Myxococcota bacterium]